MTQFGVGISGGAGNFGRGEMTKILLVKLQDFYASLNDDQKAKFNIMGPPPNASAQQKQSGGQ